MQEEEGKVFKCFHFDWPRGEVGGGDEIGSFHAFNHSRHIRQRQRRERVEFVSTQQKKKGGQICLVVEFRKNFETKKYVDFGIMQRIHFSA